MVNLKSPDTALYSVPDIEAYHPFFRGKESLPVRPARIATKVEPRQIRLKARRHG